MGFHIRLNTSSEQILGRLKTSPEQIFYKRYHCYLLFLVGATDDEAMDWLVKNVVPLDSLTGKELAFGIFMKALKMPLQVSTAPKTPKPKVAATIPVEKLQVGDMWAAERIIKQSIRQHVYTGDEIMAITYATDVVAREFNVIDRLPCMLLLDPIPFGKVQVIQLSNAICNNLINVLRQSIHRYLNEIKERPSAFSYTSDILDAQNNLDAWEKRKDILTTEVSKLEADLARLNGTDQAVTGIAYVIRRINAAKKQIEKGAVRKTKLALFGELLPGENYRSRSHLRSTCENAVTDFLVNRGSVLRSCIITIEALIYNLDKCDNSAESKDRINYIYHHHILSLLGKEEQIDIEIQKEHLHKWIEKLQLKRKEIINEFNRLLPSPEKIEKEMQDELRRINKDSIQTVEMGLKVASQNLNEYKKQYVSEKDRLEKLLDASIRLYQSNDPVLFSTIFAKEARSLKLGGYLSQTKVAGGKFAENVFKPDTIMKIIEFIHKMTG